MRQQLYDTYAWKKARRAARIRAAHQCQRCGRSPGKGELHVHHRRPLKDAPALGLWPMNFAVLCATCHAIIEPPYGKQRFGCDVTGQPLGDHPWNKQPGRGV
jgi:5-methylcytosine-specific restriction endonuclease McrA